MPIKLKTAAPAKHVDAPAAKTTKTVASKKPKVVAAGDELAPTKTKGAKLVDGPGAIASAPLLSTIAESFPVEALSELSGKGLSGTTFMLDGGSLRGLKLQARRVLDGEQKGFELVFQLTEGKLEGLLARMKEKKATKGPVTFRGAELGEGGVAKLNDQTATLESSSTHAPDDVDGEPSSWMLSAKDTKGAQVSVVHDKAALAVRGMVRIELRGDDAKCTEQLKSALNAFGLQHVFAPPTPKSQRVNLLMRALWQADQAAAKSFSGGDLDKLKVADLEAALESVGYSKARIEGLRYEEVFPGHFTVVDPQQVTEMVEAGARYLYSTVTSPEHVHSILQNGQKASAQRYKDGLIIEGMSTGADFVTGGAVGVFTRLVTQNAIYAGESWTGRTYKLLQNVSQLGRTDWYGWDGDYFGRRWDLETKTNFGHELVKKIDGDGSYQTSNELIFTAGNRPQNIDRVIATTEEARQTLVAHLKAQNHQPHNGLSVEDFVVLSPEFLVFGPSPFKDVADLPKFTEEALADAKKGKLGKLQWLLFEGPKDAGRAKLEAQLLLSGPEEARGVLLKAASKTGTFAMDAEALDGVLGKLSSKQKAVYEQLASSAAEALFRSGSDGAFKLLSAHKDTDSWQPYGLGDDAFVRIYRDLAAKQAPGKPKSKLFELALDTRAESLLESGHAGFKSFLQEYPQVKPDDPAAFLAKKLTAIKKNGAGKAELAMYLAQLSDHAEIGAVQKRLLEADADSTLGLLRSTIAVHGGLFIEGAALKKALLALPAKSATREAMLSEHAAELLKSGDAELFEALKKKFKGPYESNMGIYDGAKWLEIVKAQKEKGATEVLKGSYEAGAYYLLLLPEFKEMLSKMTGLYEVGANPATFAAAALKKSEKSEGGGLAKLGWMLFGPQAAELRMPAIKAILKSDDYQARQLITPGDGKFPASPAELRELVADADKKGLEALLYMAGKDVMLAADAETLTKLRKHFEGVEDGAMSALGLWGDGVTKLLASLSEQPEARALLLELGSRSLIKSGDASFLGYLQSAKLRYADLGHDAKWAAETAKAACDDQNYYWTNSYYKKMPEYQKLPAGAAYLMKDAKGEYDEKVLGELLKLAKGWNKTMLTAFVGAAKDLPDDWKKKFSAVKGS